MSGDEVLGFEKKDAFIRESISRGRVYPEKITTLLISINKEFLVPVRLKTKSVSLEEHKREIKRRVELTDWHAKMYKAELKKKKVLLKECEKLGKLYSLSLKAIEKLVEAAAKKKAEGGK